MMDHVGEVNEMVSVPSMEFQGRMPVEWSAFVAHSAAQPFAWGGADCMTDPAEWARVVTGIDLAAAFRGRYHDPESCRSLFRAQGGITRALRAHVASHGFRETPAPQPGAFGLVRAYGMIIGGRRAAVFPMGAILMPSGRWRIKTPQAAVTHAFPLIVAWSLQPCRQ